MLLKFLLDTSCCAPFPLVRMKTLATDPAFDDASAAAVATADYAVDNSIKGSDGCWYFPNGEKDMRRRNKNGVLRYNAPPRKPHPQHYSGTGGSDGSMQPLAFFDYTKATGAGDASGDASGAGDVSGDTDGTNQGGGKASRKQRGDTGLSMATG